MLAAQVILVLVALYLAVGLIFGVVFITIGVGRIDPAARGSSPIFRLLILPGSIAVWPHLFRRWFFRAGSISDGGVQ